MEGEQLRVFLILHAFFQGVCALSREYHDKTITAERLANRVKELAQSYEQALKKDKT